MAGVWPREKAVRDALLDLQHIQLGMMAGIRAIIAEMLQALTPQRLEEQGSADVVVSKLPFSTAKKAALWDYFMRNYQRTAGEIEDDFHTLFGEAFLHAYDMEVNQYKDSQTRVDDA